MNNQFSTKKLNQESSYNTYYALYYYILALHHTFGSLNSPIPPYITSESDQVYDVTKFLEDHPGGDEVLISSTGKDATDDFEDVGHSSSAKTMMEDFLVGEIDASTIPSKKAYTPPKQPHYNQDKTSEFIVKLLQFLVPLIILGLAVGLRFYTKSEA